MDCKSRQRLQQPLVTQQKPVTVSVECPTSFDDVTVRFLTGRCFVVQARCCASKFLTQRPTLWRSWACTVHRTPITERSLRQLLRSCSQLLDLVALVWCIGIVCNDLKGIFYILRWTGCRVLVGPRCSSHYLCSACPARSWCYFSKILE